MDYPRGFTAGTVRGYDWKLLRLCDVFQVNDQTEAYFLFINNKLTGDNFPTLRSLFDYVECLPDIMDKE